ncbi:MAG: glycoside hydrolase family 127 protein, partial [Tepidisphaerales bacterium]
MRTIIALLSLLALTPVLATAAGQAAQLSPVPVTAVQLQDSFWAPRLQLNRQTVIPHNIKFCQTTGRIDNFAKAGGLMPGSFEGIFFNDSDVYKVLEGCAYSLGQFRDPVLEKTVDDIIDKIASAQQPDGYLYTFYTLRKELDKRFSNLKDMHEMYCAGHLIEGAVAYYQATGKRKLLDVAIKLADCLDNTFGPDKRHGCCGHEEIELALVKLAGVTKNPRYFKLAEFFINERGHDACGRKLYGDYAQDDIPLRTRAEIAGHAVRAMYFFAGAADVAAAGGDQQTIKALDTIWHDVVDRKMYLTGGIGPSAHNEGFTVPYDLPNDSAYAETCAAIGMVFWNHRMALLHADAKYADVMERCMYNGVISGVSLDGQKFFYVNPLASRGRHHRQVWFDC